MAQRVPIEGGSGEQLAAAIIDDPTSVEPYVVYGDWLQSNGDPQGELVALMDAAARDPRLETKVAGAIRKLRAQLAVDRGIELTWRLGFVETIRAVTKDAAAWTRFLASGIARFAQTLELTATNGHLLAQGALPIGLRHLVLKGNRVADLKPLDGVRRLQTLVLEGTTKITDLGPLGALVDLVQLDLSGTRATDLSPLANLSALRSVTLPMNTVSDLAPLEELPRLEAVSGYVKRVANLRPLGKLALRRLALTYLDLVADLRDLEVLAELEELTIAYRSMPTDLSPLSGLARLRKLDLHNTRVADLGPLRELRNLVELDLSSTDVSDLTPLASLINLELVSLRFTASVTDVSPLATLPKLAKLDVVYTGVRQAQRRALMEALPALDISPNLTAP